MVLPTGRPTSIARVDGYGRKQAPADSACVVPFRVAGGDGPVLRFETLNFRFHLIVVLYFKHGRCPYPFLSRQ